MTIWVDAQLSPSLAPWITEHFNIEAYSVRYLGYQSATDREIFDAARKAAATVLTKNSDFVRLLEAHGPPPRVIWVTLGNTSTARMKDVLASTLRSALALLEGGEQLVEIRDAKPNTPTRPDANRSIIMILRFLHTHGQHHDTLMLEVTHQFAQG